MREIRVEKDKHDPKGLIRESYRIDGITEGECRSIFLDWALSLPDGQEVQEVLSALLDRYAAGNEDHPMTDVMRQGQVRMQAPRRRGGWRSRSRN
ncbi:hypothetical protein [Shimia aestuarii]|uniref:hypothetical protein n=1 Tax=Shimia aestuarii TaxID=254406 RepID=UPI000B80526E|nr:hypothetical protein [Shimia aestuarii]